MPFEIERKFLVDAAAAAAVLQGREGVRMEQGYLANGAVGTRVRLAGDKAWLTLKSAPVALGTRHEWEYEIPVAEAQQMLTLPEVQALRKTRYLVEHAGNTWELDVYDGALAGLMTAEVELKSMDQMLALPGWVGREVTGQAEWDNSSLAIHGRPATMA